MGLGTWAGGTQPHFLPDGVARPFPKGSDLIIQEHFHPTGKMVLSLTTEADGNVEETEATEE